MFLGALDVTVLVDGAKLAEYDDEDTFPGMKQNCKYIEAVAGTKFAIKFTTTTRRVLVPAPGDHVEVAVFLDGTYSNGMVCDIRCPTRGSRDQFKTVLKGRNVNTSQGTYHEPYQFAPLQTNDGPVGKAKHADFKHLGEIMVKCFWCRKVGESDITYHDKPFKTAIGESVPEKCLKGRAISTRATTGPREAIASRGKQWKVSYPYGYEAFATFKFKYRSRRDLQVEGILPRSPSQVPLEERDPDDLSPEEARELVRQLRRSQQQQIEIKKEGQKKKRASSVTIHDNSDSEGVIITGEGPARKRARQLPDSGAECIDLTDD